MAAVLIIDVYRSGRSNGRLAIGDLLCLTRSCRGVGGLDRAQVDRAQVGREHGEMGGDEMSGAEQPDGGEGVGDHGGGGSGEISGTRYRVGEEGGRGEGLWISLVGRGSVAIDRQPVSFATRHAELILYLLVLGGDEGLRRDELIASLWPEVDPIEGRPRLRTALWQIRRALGGHAWRVERERGVVRFSLDGVTVDLGIVAPVVGTTILVGWNFRMPPALLERVA